jgi:hypothetical protein
LSVSLDRFRFTSGDRHSTRMTNVTLDLNNC